LLLSLLELLIPPSSTIIDHIVTNDISHSINSGVLLTDISDHFSTICNVAEYRKLKISTPIFIRDKANFNPDKFNQNLETAQND